MSNKKSKRYEQQVEEVRSRLNGRDYVLGLDLGVGSIGLAAIAEDMVDGTKYPTDIVFTTSRIFNPSTGAADRRMFRGQRNAIRHKKHRLEFLWKLLAEKGLMLPFKVDADSKDPAVLRFDADVRAESPYTLRLKGLKEELSLPELGYALYHIANHRGSSSIRSFLDEEVTADDKKAKEQERETESIAKKAGVSTFIEVLAAYNGENGFIARNRDKRKDKNVPMPTRDIIASELDALLKIQASYHPELDAEYVSRIKEAVMYENEKLVPEAGNCPYFPREQKLPRCHFLSEERRLWEAINNARVKVPQQEPGKLILHYEPRMFEDDERQKLFNYLREGKDVTTMTVKKLFPKYKTAGEIILQGKTKGTQKIQGFRFKSLENKPFWKRFTEGQQDDFFATWTNTPDDGKLKQILVSDRFGLSETEADDALKTVQLIGDYAPIGKTATLLIMKHLQDGLTYTEAIDQCVSDGELMERESRGNYDQLPYYGEIVPYTTQALMGKAWHSAFKNRVDSPSFHKPDTNFLEEKYGRIANPVVHQTLNELRKLVNEVIEVMGKKPDEISVEMGRELKVGAERRAEISKEQADREVNAERIYKTYCLPNNLPRKFVSTFRIWEQEGEVCPYCQETISAAEIAGGQADIDHILPRAETADNSERNKVVAHKSCNLEKGKRTPYAAFSGDEKRWTAIMNHVQSTEGLKGKAWRFEMDDKAYHEYLQSKGFLSRFGTDNSYISKVAVQYLACLFDDPRKVRTLKGGETAMLRRAWHLQQVDDELAALHGASSEDSPTDKKNRTDNRHHSLDAIVAAYCSRSYTKLINTMHAKGEKAQDILDNIPIPRYFRDESLPRDFQIGQFQQYVGTFLKNNGFVSLKIDNAVNGTLLKATRYSVVAANGDDLICVVKKKLSGLKTKEGTSEEIENQINGRFSYNEKKFPEFKDRIQVMRDWNRKLLEKYRETLPLAREKLEAKNKELQSVGKRGVMINASTISKNALAICGGSFYLLSNNTRSKVFVTKEPTETGNGEAFDTGSNLCVDIYLDAKGKLQGEVIRKVNAMHGDYIPAYKKAGYTLLERLYQGDIVEIDKAQAPENGKVSRIVASTNAMIGNSIRNRCFMKIVTFSENGNAVQIHLSNIAKAHNDQDASFNVGSMGKYHPRKVSLSSAGFVKFVSQVLEDKEEP